jgi:hypothetical protein
MTYRSRSWILTLWDTETLEVLKNSEPHYLVYAPEECPTTGKKHFQCFVYYKEARHQSAMRKLYKGHDVQIAKGTAEQNKKYIFGPYNKNGKEKPFNPNAVEIGEFPRPGKRNDLHAFVEAIEDGLRERELNTEFLELRGKYMKFEQQTIKEICHAKARELFADGVSPEVHVRWGPPRTGKTRYVYEKHGEENVYRMTFGDGSKGSIWWCDYNGQDVILLDEFEGDMPRGLLLQLMDRYPLSLQTKGGRTWRCCKYIYICSNTNPEQWYATDKYEAISKRFTSITEVI